MFRTTLLSTRDLAVGPARPSMMMPSMLPVLPMTKDKNPCSSDDGFLDNHGRSPLTLQCVPKGTLRPFEHQHIQSHRQHLIITFRNWTLRGAAFKKKTALPCTALPKSEFKPEAVDPYTLNRGTQHPKPCNPNPIKPSPHNPKPQPLKTLDSSRPLTGAGWRLSSLVELPAGPFHSESQLKSDHNFSGKSGKSSRTLQSEHPAGKIALRDHKVQVTTNTAEQTHDKHP